VEFLEIFVGLKVNVRSCFAMCFFRGEGVEGKGGGGGF